MDIGAIQDGPSPIQEFYANKKILLTGGTGFLGMAMVEKILRACPNVGKIYLLLRQKKGVKVTERLTKVLESPLYDLLKLKDPTVFEKLELLTGDVGVENLGLSMEDKQKIIDEVDIVIHGAATVKFNEHIRVATQINVRGTRDLLLLAKEMKHLQAFVHISTAYSHCPKREIFESFFEAPYDYKKLITLVYSANDKLLEELTPTLIGQWPNTYVFTKAVAEEIVRVYGEGLPVVLFRPSQVISTLEEPIPGWVNNYYGLMGFSCAAAVGLIRMLRVDLTLVADMVPVDFVANSVIATAWDVSSRFNKKEIASNSVVKVFNYTSTENPINWDKFTTHLIKYGKPIYSNLAMWYPFVWLVKSSWVAFVANILLHYFPAVLVDIAMRITGRKPFLLKAYQKIHCFMDLGTYFTVHEWYFHNNNTRQLYQNMTKHDQRTFNFDMKSFTWEEYAPKYARGLRIYMLNDPMDTVPQAQKRLKFLKVLHYSVGILLLFLFLSFGCYIVRKLF